MKLRIMTIVHLVDDIAQLNIKESVLEILGSTLSNSLDQHDSIVVVQERKLDEVTFGGFGKAHVEVMKLFVVHFKVVSVPSNHTD
jgi:hypothetical protein